MKPRAGLLSIALTFASIAPAFATSAQEAATATPAAPRPRAKRVRAKPKRQPAPTPTPVASPNPPPPTPTATATSRPPPPPPPSPKPPPPPPPPTRHQHRPGAPDRDGASEGARDSDSRATTPGPAVRTTGLHADARDPSSAGYAEDSRHVQH